MERQVSIVVVYPADVRLKSIRRVMEDVFDAELEIGKHSRVGGAYACIIDVRVPDGFKVRAARRRIKRELPAVRIKTMERFCESWWARHQWAIAIGVGSSVGSGIAMAFIHDLLGPLVARMREALG